MTILIPVRFATGLLLWDVTRYAKLVDALGVVRIVDTVHVLIFEFFCGFIVVHVYLASPGHRGGALQGVVPGGGGEPTERTQEVACSI